MTENDREKRLYYLRKYNRYYKYQIDLLTDQSTSLKQQITELKEENEQLRKRLLLTANGSEKKSSSNISLELMHIRKMIEHLCATQPIPLHSNDIEGNRKKDYFIGAIHRQTEESTYANELRKEFVINMNEETNDERFNKEQDPSSMEDDVEQFKEKEKPLQVEQQINDTKEEKRGEDEATDKRPKEVVQAPKQGKGGKSESTLSRQVKEYGKIEETASEKAIVEQEEKQSLTPAERENTITFRELQQATDIYAKPTMQMNRSNSSGNKHSQFDTPLTHVEQEESFLPKLSKHHKKPEIVQKPIPEQMKQPTQTTIRDQRIAKLDEEKTTVNKDEKIEVMEQRANEQEGTEKNDNEFKKQFEDTGKQVEDTTDVPRERDHNETIDHTSQPSAPLPDDSIQQKKDRPKSRSHLQEELPLVEMDYEQTERAKQTDEQHRDQPSESNFFKTLWNKIKGT